MNKDQLNLAGKVVLSDQLATQLFLTEKESVALQAGFAINDSLLEEMRDPQTGRYIDGAEDLAVEKACQIVPGYGDALEKWANGFRSILISGKG
jgi:hypothetical protein